MQTRLFGVVVVACLTGLACSSKKSSDEGAAGLSSHLSEAQLTEASKMAKADLTTPWDEAWEKITKHLGPPMTTEGKAHYWYAVKGDQCIELTLEDLRAADGSGAQPTGIGLGTIDPDRPGEESATPTTRSMAYARCTKTLKARK